MSSCKPRLLWGPALIGKGPVLAPFLELAALKSPMYLFSGFVPIGLLEVDVQCCSICVARRDLTPRSAALIIPVESNLR
jgi:hypothetical protein